MSPSFPPLYAGWMETLLGGPLPEERGATCFSCPIAAGTATRTTFHPLIRCCTFFPEMPSFAIGQLFLDEDPALARGRELLARRIEIGQQVSPLGIAAPASYRKLYRKSDETFGVAEALRCPYLTGDGACAVWRYRESTCATWYCKHERGAVGKAFWNAVRVLLKTVEVRLAIQVAVELGIDRGAIDAVRATTATLHRELDPEYHASLWGPWAGRERDYYVACAELVQGLSWEEARARCGGDSLGAPEEETRLLFERVRTPPALPELVAIRPLRRVRREGDVSVLATYSDLDALPLPDTTIAALVRHDVVRVDELIAEPGVDASLVLKLLDVGLIEPGG